MKIKLILSLIVICLNSIACENNQSYYDHIESLKDSGYKYLSCKLQYNESLNTFDFISEVIPVSNEVEMLLARCNQFGCNFEVVEEIKTPTKILCQRFYNTKEFTSKYDVEQTLLSFNTDYFLDIKE